MEISVRHVSETSLSSVEEWMYKGYSLVVEYSYDMYSCHGKTYSKLLLEESFVSTVEFIEKFKPHFDAFNEIKKVFEEMGFFVRYAGSGLLIEENYWIDSVRTGLVYGVGDERSIKYYFKNIFVLLACLVGDESFGYKPWLTRINAIVGKYMILNLNKCVTDCWQGGTSICL